LKYPVLDGKIFVPFESLNLAFSMTSFDSMRVLDVVPIDNKLSFAFLVNRFEFLVA